MSSDECPTLDNFDGKSTGFLFDAVDLGMEYAKQVGDGFTPLATILGKDGSKDVWKLVGDEAGSWGQEEGIALGREKLRELDDDAHCVTLVYDGYFTGDGGRTDAVFVEAYELGRPAGVHMCQRYERRYGSVNLIGNPLLLDDETEPLVPPNRPGVEYPNIGPDAKRLALDAIKLGIERAEAGYYRIIPFATILGEDGLRDTWHFVDDEANPTVGGGLELAHQRLLSVDRTSRCVALVWGGDMSDDGTEDSDEDYSPTGAVFVECYELGRPAGVILVQGYKRWDADSVALSGGPQVLEESEPLVPADQFGVDGIPHLSSEAGEFTLNLLEVGMGYAAESENGFIPFEAVLGNDGSYDLSWLVDDETNPTVDGGVALGRQRVRGVDGSAHCVALVWDGYAELYGERTEAVYVEAYELGRPAGVLMIQRYDRQDGRLSLIETPVLYDGKTDPLVPPREHGRSAAFARIQQMAEEQRRRRES